MLSIHFNHCIFDFLQRCKNAQKAIKLQIWTWQLIKGKFDFKIPKFHLSYTD